MNKQVALMLAKKVEFVAELFSNPNRPLNQNREEFMIEKVTVLSEFTAAVTFRKNTNKLVMAFFYYVKVGEGRWDYFFPSDSHLLGMSLMCQAKQRIEEANYGFNFSEVDNSEMN